MYLCLLNEWVSEWVSAHSLSLTHTILIIFLFSFASTGRYGKPDIFYSEFGAIVANWGRTTYELHSDNLGAAATLWIDLWVYSIFDWVYCEFTVFTDCEFSLL